MMVGICLLQMAPLHHVWIDAYLMDLNYLGYPLIVEVV